MVIILNITLLQVAKPQESMIENVGKYMEIVKTEAQKSAGWFIGGMLGMQLLSVGVDAGNCI